MDKSKKERMTNILTKLEDDQNGLVAIFEKIAIEKYQTEINSLE